MAKSKIDSYVLPERVRLGKAKIPEKLPIVPLAKDVPPHPFFRMIVEHWQEIVDRTDGHCIYQACRRQSMTACEHASEALYEWVGEHEDELVDEDGKFTVSDLAGYEGLWAGDPDMRHVWLEAWVRDPDTKKYDRWVIDPTANQFALEETHGYNDPRPLVIMPAKGPRYKRFYRNKSALDDFETSSF